jgi:PIN domain nuclease of toxin-antitoxin system
VRVLLDTHAFLWWLGGDPKLSLIAREVIVDDANVILVSAASAWEIATKHRLGRLPGAAAIAPDIASIIAGHGFDPLPVTVAHGQHAGALPGPYRDPFDRMLIAQALTEGCALASNETVFDRYGVSRLW